MAKAKTKKTEEVVDKNVSEEKVETKEVKQPKKEKSSNFKEDGTYVVDLDKINQKEEVKKEDDKKVEDKKVEKNEPTITEVVEEKQPENKKEEEVEQPVLEEIKADDNSDKKEIQSPAVENQTSTNVEEQEIKENTPGMELPENIQKVVSFMNETGGTLEDYVRLNADYSKLDDSSLLNDYYKQTKPHLSQDERNFLIEDNFKFDEEVDEERDVKRKKLAYKEAVAEARNHLEQMKGKYYDELKMGSKLPPAQQKAVDFFNRYNKEQEQVRKLTQQQQAHFDKKTNEVFNNEFKGFEFEVEDKKYRYNIKDVDANKNAQSNVLNVFSKYINKDNLLNDARGYHKSLFAARNPDAIANHFYQQGKADAIKQITAESKNINMDPRKSDSSIVDTGGVKYKVISGDDSRKLKAKLKNY